MLLLVIESMITAVSKPKFSLNCLNQLLISSSYGFLPQLYATQPEDQLQFMLPELKT